MANLLIFLLKIAFAHHKFERTCTCVCWVYKTTLFVDHASGKYPSNDQSILFAAHSDSLKLKLQMCDTASRLKKKKKKDRIKKLENWLSTQLSSVATIFGPPANNLCGSLAKGLRYDYIFLTGPWRALSAPRAPRGLGACRALAMPLTQLL